MGEPVREGGIFSSGSGIVAMSALTAAGVTFAYAKKADSSSRKNFALVSDDLDLLGKKITTLSKERKQLLIENEDLKHRVSELESTVADLGILVKRLGKKFSVAHVAAESSEEEAIKKTVPKPKRLKKKPVRIDDDDGEELVLSTKKLGRNLVAPSIREPPKKTRSKRSSSAIEESSEEGESKHDQDSDDDGDAESDSEEKERRKRVADLM